RRRGRPVVRGRGRARPGATPALTRVEEAELASAVDGFGPGGALELSVHGGEVTLHGAAGDVQLVPDLRQGEVGGKELEDTNLRTAERHRAGFAAPSATSC